ncbi:MAG: NAD(P)/FAD-dependent oxidoreductase [Actinobacteria bacterium]|nr:NAD(P)/FAD-dependent oxidoreductase [Actinomycetota bacterium]
MQQISDDSLDEFDVVVIGAGYGGVTSAALLTHHGLRVALIDKNDRPGGKAMTLRDDDYGYELWPIAGGPAVPSRFHELLDMLGLSAEAPILTPDHGGEFQYRHPEGTWVAVPFSAHPAIESLGDPAAAGRLPEALGASQEQTAAMITLAATVLTLPDDDIDALDPVDARSWIHGFGVGRALESYLFTLCNLLFVVAVDRLPASEAVRTLRDFFRGGGGRYHAGGYARPAEALVEYVAGKGGHFLPHTRVREILVEGGRAAGVSTGRSEVRAPIVISNAGIQPTVLKLLPEGSLPDDYVERVRALEPSWAFVGARYVVDAPIFDAPMVLRFTDDSWWDDARYQEAAAGHWPDDPLLFVTVPSLYDPSLAPGDGHQAALAGTMCSPDPESPMSAAAVERVHEAMLQAWPELARHTVRREAFTARHVAAASRDSVVAGQGGECIGIAQVLGQCGHDKPDVRSPLPGLYFVGCDAGGYGCGTHQAVESGFNVASVVAEDLSHQLAADLAPVGG